VTYQEPLSQRVIAVSISESPDMDALGLGKEHLEDAMAEIARHLLAMGAQLVYGGDLRPKGFTELLFELVARHRRDADAGDERVGVSNVLAWPVHVSLPAGDVRQLADDLRGAAELVCLALDGQVMTEDERRSLEPRPATDDEWPRGLTTMRHRMREMSDARIVLGGRVERFKGRMPGVAEEALIALQAGQPLFVLGGFGGCARDIAEQLGFIGQQGVARPHWPGKAEFTNFRTDSLNNGLLPDENTILSQTVHIDQAITLILRGLFRRFGGGTSEEAH
jgi:hypothetical protein